MKPTIKVWEMMTSDLKSVHPDTPLKTIESIFSNNNFHHLPVEDNLGAIVGIIGTGDLSRVRKFGWDEKDIRVRHIMTASIEYISMDETLKSATDLFVEKNLRAIPVLDKSKVFVGLLTSYDLLKSWAQIDG